MKLTGWMALITTVCAFSFATSLPLFALPEEAQNPAGQKVIDLSHSLASGQPDFHNQKDAFTYKSLFTIAKDGYADGAFCMPEHYGTHIDAPAHFVAGATTIDRLPVDKLILPAFVIDAKDQCRADADYIVSVDKIKEYEKDGLISANSVVLLNTGWAKKWADAAAYRNADKNGVMHFPGFSKEAVAYLINQKHVAAIGIDTLSLDCGASRDFSVHKLGLAGGLFFIENLDNLDLLPARGATLFMAPLAIKNGSGAPARVLATIKI